MIILKPKWWRCPKVIFDSKKDNKGIFPYSGFFDCIKKSIKNEGFGAFWIGIGTYYMRIAPHAMITVLAQDFFHDLMKDLDKHWYILKKEYNKNVDVKYEW